MGVESSRFLIDNKKSLDVLEVEVAPADFEGAYALDDVLNTETGEVIIESNTEIVAGKLQQIIEEGVPSFSVFFPKRDVIGEVIAQTLRKDAITKPVDALLENPLMKLNPL